MYNNVRLIIKGARCATKTGCQIKYRSSKTDLNNAMQNIIIDKSLRNCKHLKFMHLSKFH